MGELSPIKSRLARPLSKMTSKANIKQRESLLPAPKTPTTTAFRPSYHGNDDLHTPGSGPQDNEYTYDSPPQQRNSKFSREALHIATPAKTKLGYFPNTPSSSSIPSASSMENIPVPPMPSKVRSGLGLDGGRTSRLINNHNDRPTTPSAGLIRPSSRAALSHPHPLPNTIHSRRTSSSINGSNPPPPPGTSSIRFVESTSSSSISSFNPSNGLESSGSASPGTLKKLWIQSMGGEAGVDSGAGTTSTIGGMENERGESRKGKEDGVVVSIR